MTNQKTILFVEDEQELLSTLGQVLRDRGYSVIATSTAEDALKALKQTPPDLILADIKLPGIDGFDFYKMVRKMEGFTGIPVVFLTAFNNLQAETAARQEGVAEYITKPFEFEYLIYRLQTILSSPPTPTRPGA